MPDSSSQPDFAERPSPWTRPWFLASAAVLALIVIAGLVVALVPSPHESRPGGHPPAATGSPSTVGQPPAALPTTIPTTPPADVTWALVGQSVVPVSRSAGPRTIADTASGYAHSPEGALIAAAQLGERAGFSAGRKSWEPTITRQFVPSP